MTDPRRGPHPANTLNELPGEEWLYFTKSLLTTAYPSELGHHARRAHGANKPPRLMARLIEFFKAQDLFDEEAKWARNVGLQGRRTKHLLRTKTIAHFGERRRFAEPTVIAVVIVGAEPRSRHLARPFQMLAQSTGQVGMPDVVARVANGLRQPRSCFRGADGLFGKIALDQHLLLFERDRIWRKTLADGT